MHARLPIDYVGRLVCKVEGFDNDGNEAVLPANALVRVANESDFSDISPSDPYRYCVVLLLEHGSDDPRNISWDGCFAGLLVPEPGVPAWMPEDGAAARRQGWDIFFPDAEDHPTFELQKIDGSEEDTTPPSAHVVGDRFKTDNDAWVFVWKGAVEHKDPLALRALAFLYARSRREYDEIRKFNTDMALGHTADPVADCQP